MMSSTRTIAERAIDSVWLKCALILASLLFTLACAEGMGRLFYYIRWGGFYGPQPRQYSLRLGWEMAPGSYESFHINEQGFRRPNQVSFHPPENTIRIFMVGGSTALGHQGVYRQFGPRPLSYEDTIDYHLQAMMHERHQGIRFEVINAGVTEYRLFQEITLFREKLAYFRPHLVIFLDGHNDISFLTGGMSQTALPAPYWANRHFRRGENVLNQSGVVGPLHFLDVYLGRVSYFYHGLSALFQRLQEFSDPIRGGRSGGWGKDPFRYADEKRIMATYRDQLSGLEQALPLYLDQVRDLKAIASARQIKVLYALQPELVVENPSHLTTKEVQIQEAAFRHHRDFGTLSWRFLSSRMTTSLTNLSDDQFQFVNLVTIAAYETQDVYTDYCHLTPKGNRVIAEKLYPWVVDLIGVEHLGPNDTINRDSRE